MEKQQIERFRQLLLEQRDQIAADTLTHDGTPDQDPDSADVRDPGEESVHSSTEIVEARLNEDYRNLLMKIDLALKRLDAGTYDECAECGRKIPLERLEAKPSASLCLSCQEAKDASKS